MTVERTRFLTLGLQRSGTTVTHLAFRGHPNVSALSDELGVHPFFSKGVDVFTVGEHNDHDKRHGFRALFDAVCLIRVHDGNARPEQILAVGAKTALSSAGDAEVVVGALQAYLKDLVVVRVRRRDSLALLASRMRAERTGQWHSWTADGDAGAAGRFAIPPDTMAAFHHDVQAIEAVVDRLQDSHRVCEIDYDRDICSADPQRFGRMFEAVGVPALEPTWLESEKVAPPVEKFVENARELRRMLARMGE